MEITPGVFGAVFALVIGLIAATRSLERFRGRYRCLAYIEAIASFLGVIGGAIAALGNYHKWWPYIVAVVLGIIPASVLYGRLQWELYKQKALGKFYQGFCPYGALEAGASFTRVLSIAINQYGRISAPNIPLLSFSSLRQAYKTVARNGRWLSFNGFKTECVLGLKFNDAKGFRDRAALVIFADPSVTDQCREWFVQHTELLKAFRAAVDDELANIVRFMWKCNVFSVAARRDCALDALYRLSNNKAVARALCEELLKEFSTARVEDRKKDIWIIREIPRYLANYVGVDPFKLPHKDTLQWSIWYVPGDETECQVCGHRPSEAPTPWENTWYERRKRAFRAPYHCESCNLNTLSPLKPIAPQPLIKSKDSSIAAGHSNIEPHAMDEAEPSSARIANVTGPNTEQCIIDVTSPTTTETTQ